MTKVAGAKNPADILMKYKGLRDLKDQLMRVNVRLVARGQDKRGGGTSRDKIADSTVGGRAAGKTRVVSRADALDEEQQAREMNCDDGLLG